ncbi:flavin-dependent dehydrogenase [Cricetibacter osteomyelitidis]|uniref:Flavin-dependent dehydrogenase n=1 Tax=Cricetibacter osteomyelitidis TaxID=1521931 RepID=A0A4R2TJB7_9PAST|nr:NAD(P)/FAD-dependent oxidoreductase [Cricetibacter osteomyelitidis]TCP94902.1 flavin-dependent dehydrogenase [Cricetibacter osteomyelitidis]
MKTVHTDIAIIGAGPSGSVAAGLLRKKGYKVLVLERQVFPRFSIGESLLPHCMELIEKAGMAETIKAAGFQHKNGAAFTWGNRYTYFDFTDKFTPGPGTTYQVQRGIFDKVLIDEAEKQGADVWYEHTVLAAETNSERAKLLVRNDKTGEEFNVAAKFLLDASGYGRVLARLFDLETPSCLPVRHAHFTHIEDNITDGDFDRNKILICTHPTQRDVWLWFIPFSNGRCSIGVVSEPHNFAHIKEQTSEGILRQYASEIPMLSRLIRNAKWDTPFNTLQGYSANVKSLYGERWALLGNASEFLDPVFSSGVTVAMHSSDLAVETLDKQLRGEPTDWQKDFVEPLMVGINTFRTYVFGWYDNSFQDVIYERNPNPKIRAMISSILAGYAWDSNNPYVEKSERRLKALADICGTATQD